MEVVNGAPWVPRHHNRICSMHFVRDRKSDHPESPSYNPTIFKNSTKIKTDAKTAVDRFQRRLKRTLTKESNFQSFEEPKKKKMCSMSSFPVNETIENVENAENIDSIDAGTQVDFLSDDNNDDGQDISRKDGESYLCKYYSTDFCDVEIQVYRPKINKPKQKKVVIPEAVIQVNASNNIDTNTNNHTSNRSGFYGYSSIKEASELNDLGGVKLETFQLLLKIMKRKKVDDRTKISLEDQLFIFLMKMRCGLTFTSMAVLFNLHRTTISKVFYDTLMYLAGACKEFLIWPSKETIQARFRIKILVCCTPSGYISYVSRSYGGRATDCQITSMCGFLDLLETGDQVLADKGFPQVKTQLDESGRGVLIIMPPFLHDTFSEEQVEETYKVASVRIHIERVIQRIRTYKIVDKFTIEMLPYCDAIIFMCCVLVNLQSPILKDVK
ncbi:uncharacterized protein LOC123270120 [Cotesia glomerata]|uniref:uncharacterized protein LOC123270120 n=1 Tax=Cotesia glomerata TaxID=32391 RepID=UPI001D00DD49|nr:uncharacterized protein LOC123270120 [Cotesia glomerata]